MNPKELTLLYENLHLDDSYDPMGQIERGRLIEGMAKLDLVLMGRVLVSKTINEDALEEVRVRLVAVVE